MATFVLVHGAFHGGWSWKKLSPLLRAAGHDVFTPTLTGLGERIHLHLPDIDLNTHVRDILNVIEYEELNDIILLGHSYAGYIISLVAEQLPERISHLVYLDALLPIDGESMKETYRPNWEGALHYKQGTDDSWWCPWTVEYAGDYGMGKSDLAWLLTKVTPHPMRTWLTPVSIQNPAARNLPHTYVFCAGKGGRPLSMAETMGRDLTTQGWNFHILDTGHDAMLTAPDELNALLLTFT